MMSFVDTSKPNAKTLKRDINIKSVLKYFDIEIDENSKCVCPFHADVNPSMLVNDVNVWCFAGCGGFDIYSFVQRFKELKDFKEAHAWVADHVDEFPEVVSSGSRKRGEYRGPVHPDLVSYYHSCLDDEHRHILHTKRLLTDDTINRLKIGWRPEYKAYSLPFWSGEPGKSEIAILQFRLTDETPKDIQEQFSYSKFIGLSGHNKPYLVNKNLLTKKWAIMLFGTFDGYLAGQDGFPATSPNGVSVFSQKKWAGELNQHLTGIETLYVVMDKTESERSSVTKLVNLLTVPNVVTKEFPDGPWKDYGDYRLHKSAEDFMVEVLGWKLL
jgi:hypothetical protein